MKRAVKKYDGGSDRSVTDKQGWEKGKTVGKKKDKYINKQTYEKKWKERQERYAEFTLQKGGLSELI